MPLSITLTEKEGIQALELEGRLTLGSEEVIFRDSMEAVLAQGKNRIVVDLREVIEIDDVGMESLITAQAKCRDAGGNLVLANLHPALIQPLTTGKLKASLDVFGSEQEGINSFFPNRCVAPVDLSRYIKRLAHQENDPERR